MPNNIEWIAQWKSTKTLTDQWMSAGKLYHFSSHALLLILDGKAIWNINGHRVQVSYGELIVVQENSVIEVNEGGQLDLAGWLIQFDTYATFPDRGEVETYEWHVPSGNTYQKVKLTGGTLASLSQHWSEEGSPDPNAIRVRNQYLVYELLQHVYRELLEEEPTVEQGILRSVDYMQQHYEQVITRKQLAKVAGISPWHYSRKFSERYGRPPLDYLAHYRIYRAQEELLLTSATSQDIAKKTGFEDAHYFSRRFKQLTGVSPRNYAQTLPQRKIVCLSPLCAEVLIHLGIIPHAVVVTLLLLPEHQIELFESHQVKMLEVPQYELDVELIRQVQPEWIVGNFWTEEIKQRLRTISPIITGLNHDVEALLHQMAGLFHREDTAHKLHMQMKMEVNTAHQQLLHLVQSSSTVMVLRVEPFGYRYLGRHSNGVSHLLYEQLCLTLPQPLQAGEAWFNPCSLDLLAKANPDYLFVEKRVMQHFSAEENMKNLMESSQWNELRAVKNNRVFHVDTRLWVDGRGIIGNKMILNEIVKSLVIHP
ncbi:helix-turn-helix domain-containing protein [Paenibacillus pabuli]|uniref:helix-turn-helix domain-containing protein n=1 Tax=Paenibacillus pabuli TaxID=1472 RepID=UPI001FFEEDCC|nr:helix-turn-helix domain-containing protein [Paenibacillus pabuli]UPK42549.1 helix-turn-helix domain-containing protein [Paenibacillus pabuli]